MLLALRNRDEHGQGFIWARLPGERGRAWPRAALASGLLCLSIVLIMSFPTSGWALLSRAAGGKLVGIEPRASLTSRSPAPHFDALGNLDYHGGPVLHESRTYAIFWDPTGAFPARTAGIIAGYLSNAAHDSTSPASSYAVSAQYFDPTGHAAYRQSFGGSFADGNPYPSAGCGDPAGIRFCLTDAQIATELSSFLDSHGLPRGLGNIYFLYTPPGVVTCVDFGKCSDNAYCAYHAQAGGGSSVLLYAGEPWQQDKSCQIDGNGLVQAPNNDPAAEVITKTTSHEHNEIITDPLISGWYDAAGLENGDKCHGTDLSPSAFSPTISGTASQGNLATQRVNGALYYIQSEWSNLTASCLMTVSVNPAFAPPSGTQGVATNFNASGSTAMLGVGAYSWNFGDGSPPASGASVDHVYTTAGTFSATLTVEDQGGNAASTTSPVAIQAAPSPPHAAVRPSRVAKRTARRHTSKRVCHTIRDRRHHTSRVRCSKPRPKPSAKKRTLKRPAKHPLQRPPRPRH